ncbi:FKBP-type peptidyl-prolyl cis-trans isomerase SlyD [hydrothermal vent metagenome]|uniref:peptidylprolyl isomerase n=1 Tax=hydrothermal vent metagenome TaxID=652676 RepID=A0A1W1BBZ7_9ZZZZ
MLGYNTKKLKIGLKMAIEANNCVVAISYDVKEAGTTEIVDSNRDSAPLEFITGIGQIIPGLENALVGMNAGESGDILVKAADAYGDINPDALQEVPRDQFEGIELEEGMMLYGQGEGGQTIQVVVKSFNDDMVTIDYNHPLAGKDLMFTVDVLEAREATEEEVATGQVGGAHCNDGSCGCGH